MWMTSFMVTQPETIGGYTVYMRRALELTVVAVSVILLPGAPTPACTPVPVPIARSSDDVFFIGAAAPDTIRTGAGDMKWSTGTGHSGYGQSRDIFGQLVQVEQLRGVSKDRLPAETKSVVLVPWDYGADCRTIMWGKSARWVAPDTRAVFRATLRAREHWANGLPTLDVHTPQFSLYPFDTRRLYMLRDTAMNELSLDQVLDVYERLPIDSLLSTLPDSAIQPLEAWARESPDLARREPARTILDIVRIDAEERRISLIKSPIVGTYRFVFRVPPTDSLVMYARTDERPWGAQRFYEMEAPEDSASVDKAIGYSLRTAWAKSPRALPRDADKGTSQLSISLQPILETADSSVWQGTEEALWRELNPEFWNRVIYKRYPRIRSLRDQYRFNTGSWTIYRNGTVRYRNAIEQNGTIILLIVGERISAETMARPEQDN